MAVKARPVAERVWPKIDQRGDADCWEWRGAKDTRGYGMLGMPGRTWNERSHRLVWELTYGVIPDGMCVCHSCDNPGCCNPAHLFLGTRADNNRDRHAKGRSRGATGELNYHAKLTAPQVGEIRRRFTGRYGERKALAREFGVSVSTIYFVVSGKCWKAD